MATWRDEADLLEPERSTPPRRHGRLLVVAAVVVVLTGAVAVVGARKDDDGTTRVELDGTVTDLEPGVLRPLGPRDGKDSVQLPIIAEPSTDLLDGDTVTVTGSGFEPGERVGIVQCAKEAGGDTPEARGGIDGCNVGTVQYADADDAGVATGSISVSRVLTTPLTGTVDCAAEADRCLVAMGALDDYDRSGGHAISFAPAPPIELPTVTVTPNEGLADGEVVHVVADGLTPGAMVSFDVCSSDPSTCWYTGVELHREGFTELVAPNADAGGHLEADLPVWRFLPGPEPGTYVDCAVSRCSLRLGSETAPPTVPLRFAADGPPPVTPAISVDPASDLAPGDDVLVRGAGFEPGTLSYVSLCATPAGEPATAYLACAPLGDGEVQVDGDGRFAVERSLPDLGTVAESSGAVCDVEGTCTTDTVTAPIEVRCDGVTTDCYVSVDVFLDGGPMRPTFAPSPVRVTFR